MEGETFAEYLKRIDMNVMIYPNYPPGMYNLMSGGKKVAEVALFSSGSCTVNFTEDGKDGYMSGTFDEIYPYCLFKFDKNAVLSPWEKRDVV